MAKQNRLFAQQCETHFVGIDPAARFSGCDREDRDIVHLVFDIVGNDENGTTAGLFTAYDQVEIGPIDGKLHPYHSLSA